MNTNYRFGVDPFIRLFLIVLVLAVLVFVSTDSLVRGQTGGDEPILVDLESEGEGAIEGTGIVPGGPGFIMVSPFDFQPVLPGYTWSYIGGGLYIPSPGSMGAFVTGVTLPHKATLKKLTLYYLDNKIVGDISVELTRGDGSGIVLAMESFTSAGAAVAYRYKSSTEFLDPVVDNQNYSYYLRVGFPDNGGADIVFTNVRIDYEYTTSLPVVMH